MRQLRRQAGSTLLMGLIMLLVLTLMGTSAVRTASLNMQVMGNAQFKAEAMAAAQQAIEQVISSSDFTATAPSPTTVDIDQDGRADYTVTFSPAPRCKSSSAVDLTQPGVPLVCYGSIGAVCYWTVWDVAALVTDANTKASVTVHQGVKTVSGLNAAVASCV